MDILSFFFDRSSKAGPAKADPKKTNGAKDSTVFIQKFDVISEKTAEKITKAILSLQPLEDPASHHYQATQEIKSSLSDLFWEYIEQALASTKKSHNLFSLSNKKTEAFDLKLWSHITSGFPPQHQQSLMFLRREIFNDILLACRTHNHTNLFIIQETLNGKSYEKMSLLK